MSRRGEREGARLRGCMIAAVIAGPFLGGAGGAGIVQGSGPGPLALPQSHRRLAQRGSAGEGEVQAPARKAELRRRLLSAHRDEPASAGGREGTVQRERQV